MEALRRFRLVTLVAGTLLLLAGCQGGGVGLTEEPIDSAPATAQPAEPPTEAVAPPNATQIDFGNREWLFRPGGHLPETVTVPLVDGKATVDLVNYEVGDPVFADVNGDGVVDAAVSLTAVDGNGFDQQWYLWITAEPEPIQVTLPIARTARCGTVTKSVTAVDDGIQVHEVRRGIGEDQFACSEEGLDERTRVINAVEVRNVDEWWPVQTAPVPAFGGLCPVAVEYDAYPGGMELFSAPDPAAPIVPADVTTYVFGLEGWPIYGEDFPGWRIIGVKTREDHMSCSWMPVS